MSFKVSLDEFYQKLPTEITTLSQQLGLNDVSSTTNLFRELVQEEQANLDTKPKKKQSNENKALIIDDVKRDSAIIQQKKYRNRGRQRNYHILNGKQRKHLFALRGDNAGLKYKVFVQVHRLWCAYMSELMQTVSHGGGDISCHKNSKSIVDQGNLMNSLIKADYHGAKFLVVRSKNPTLVGQKGIVIQETRNTFVLINEHSSIHSKFVCLILICKMYCFNFHSFIFCCCIFSHFQSWDNLFFSGVRTHFQLEWEFSASQCSPTDSIKV